MEDEPGTSKNLHQDHREKGEEREKSKDGRPSNSGTNISNDSKESALFMGARGQEEPKNMTTKPGHKFQDKKLKKKPSGRVEKHKRPAARRPLTRRAPKRKPKARHERKRDLSISTIYSRLTSSGSRTPACARCGHRCCRRRYKRRNTVKINGKRKYTLYYQRKKPRHNVFTASAGVQAGSRCMMLSPLNITVNSVPTQQQSTSNYSEVTPEMIYQSLRRLMMWKENVNSSDILKYISKNYPVNRDKRMLQMELLDKLSIAVIAGIVTQTSNDTWRLSCKLENRKLTENHVTLFWEVYGDPMRPIANNQNTGKGQPNTNEPSNVIDYEFI